MTSREVEAGLSRSVERPGGFGFLTGPTISSMKYYIATKLENHMAHNRVRDMLNALGHEITYDWTFHGPVYRSGLDRVREVALLETRGVVDADFIVVLWPGGRGTHVEMGIALGSGKQVIFVSADERHHESTPETCAFYHHPIVWRARHTDELPKLIARLSDPITCECCSMPS